LLHQRTATGITATMGCYVTGKKLDSIKTLIFNIDFKIKEMKYDGM